MEEQQSKGAATVDAPPVFSAAKQFIVPLQSAGRKACKVRFPTDTEWCARARKQRSIRRFLGRGKSQAQAVNTSGVDVDLFERIRSDKDGPDFTPAEAAAVLAKLERATVEDCEREGDHLRLTLRVPGAVTEHLVRTPTIDEMDAHEAASVSVVGERRQQEIRGFLEPSGELYDAIVKGVQGYDGRVPIVHKCAIVGEVLSQVAMAEEEAVPEA